jgi:hypothetical protein
VRNPVGPDTVTYDLNLQFNDVRCAREHDHSRAKPI